MQKNIKGKGRPAITVKDLKKDWEKIIVKLSKQGASIVELAVELDICRNTFYALSERDEHFMNTVKRCKEYCESWWLKNGRVNLENKDFSYTGWYMNMKNRFNWTDKRETTVEGGKNPLVLNSQINLLEKLSKEQLRQLLENE